MTASGDPARWTVDDDGDLVWTSQDEQAGAIEDLLSVAEGCRRGQEWVRGAFDALVADVRAARVHEGCGPAADTLRQARELAAKIKVLPSDHTPLGALLDLLVDGGGDGHVEGTKPEHVRTSFGFCISDCPACLVDGGGDG